MLPDVYKRQAYDGSDVIMMIAYGPMGYAYEEYMAIPSVDVLIGQSTYADVVLKGFSKAIGIRFILDHFQMQDYLDVYKRQVMLISSHTNRRAL